MSDISYDRDDGYESWLDTCGLEDTEENRGWYDCPEDQEGQYIEDHQDWWNNF